MHKTNLISQYFGKFATYEFPKPIQKIINQSYAKFMKLDMSEFKNAKHYKSLNELFTREFVLKREIDNSKNIFISPSDSLITECGKLNNDTALQIKGMEYSIEELLTYYCSDSFEKVSNGEFMNFYLSPKDYHRYHAPVDFKLKKLIHVPGKLYPVNLKYLNKEFELFVQNERVIFETNKDTKEIKVYTYDSIEIIKGDCLGYFKMGSTIVMIWEKDFVKLENLLNQNVKFGQKIATY